MIDAYQVFMCVVAGNCLVIVQQKNYLLKFFIFLFRHYRINKKTLKYKQITKHSLHGIGA